jgi:N-acetylmuramoyl-L-alanine amidase CwlA
MNKKFIGCAETNFRSGRPLDMKPEAIVIHIAVGSLRSVDAQFNDPNSHVSAHYCVGKTGEIHQYVQEIDTAFHAGIVVNPTWPLLKANVNPNFYTIGIEHEGLPDDVWPDVQINTCAALVGEIAQRWNITLDDLHVIRHHQIRASKTCPGSFITIAEILKRVPSANAAAGNQPRIVHTITSLNLRVGGPSINAPVLRVLPPNLAVSVSGIATGDAVGGNSTWYSDDNSNFLWAGGTDLPDPQN